MFRQLITRFHDLESHHQIIITVIVAFAAICVSWGIERLLEQYFFPNKPALRYLIAVIGGLLVLYLVKHFLLREI
ncbi:MAG: hypothetical protein AB7F19_06650 [Candidatus Babeliales bacterium]